MNAAAAHMDGNPLAGSFSEIAPEEACCDIRQTATWDSWRRRDHLVHCRWRRTGEG